MEGAEQLIELGKYGIVGVMLALIALIAFISYLFWKFACNHTEHSNEAFNNNTKALTQLTDAINALRR